MLREKIEISNSDITSRSCQGNRTWSKHATNLLLAANYCKILGKIRNHNILMAVMIPPDSLK